MQAIHRASGMFLAVAMLGLVVCAAASAQERPRNDIRISPNALVSQTIGTTEVTITYGRPAVREREIFGGLVPFDRVWRTGADEATTITFSEDVLVEGESLDAGTYSLFTIPRGAGEWTLIFNAIAEQWGAYRYDSAEDVLRVDVAPQEAVHMEQMMFYFEDVEGSAGKAILHWKDVKIPFQIEER
ncbi:DUF2911 domain-containing protein [Balneolales bacterium ANBcel1]|nr:DUF2911 domain-containing protein [Balneolales bacterium ANBcel1]